MIADGDASNRSIEFTKFTRAHKIICFSLLPHSTHLLQPVDVSIFGILKQNYKKLLAMKTRFSIYNVNKEDFILLIQKAGQYDISSRNIQSAWQATGLLPYNSAIVFQKLSVYEDDLSASNKDNTGAGLNTSIQAGFYSGVIPPTPENVEQVTKIEELISLFRHHILDMPKHTLLHKTLKSARLAMADRVVLNCNNTDLLAANTQKKRRAQRTEIAYGGQGAHI